MNSESTLERLAIISDDVSYEMPARNMCAVVYYYKPFWNFVY